MSKSVMSFVLLLSSTIIACKYEELPQLNGDGGLTVDAPGGCTGSASTCGANDTLYQCDEASGQLTKVQECQHGCADDHCKECEANTTSCSGDELVMCDSTGTIVNPMTCANGCQAEHCNTCKPGTSTCNGAGNAVTCGLDGEPGTPKICDAAGCANGVCNSCTPNSVTCDGDILKTCGSNGTVQATTACTWGCGTTPNAHCLVFKPSYGLPVPSGTLPDLVVDSNMDLNIRDCANSTATLGVIVNGAYQTTTLVSPQVSTVSQTGGPPICVVRFNKITVMNGFTLNVLGAGPNDHVLSLQATSDISIAGTLSFKDLPGGPAAGAKSYISVDFGINNGPGGGGGGMARAGGTGGACATCNVTVHAGSPGGAAISNIKTVLQRGSQGGGVYANIGGTDYYVNGGGSAGGALHLLSLTRVTVTSTGKLNLNGGAVVGSTSERDLGGGGGSGGALVIEAPTVSFSASGLAVANGAGGKGGCTPCTTGSPSTCTPANGESGQLSSMRAAGGNCNGGAGNGGWEANGETFPSVNGADADGSTYSSGGGGGGSRGFIFLRGKTVANVMITNGAIISPSPTIEPVTTN